VSLYKQRYGVAGRLSITLVVMALTRNALPYFRNGLLGLGLIQQSALQSLIDERCLVYIADRWRTPAGSQSTLQHSRHVVT